MREGGGGEREGGREGRREIGREGGEERGRDQERLGDEVQGQSLRGGGVREGGWG